MNRGQRAVSASKVFRVQRRVDLGSMVIGQVRGRGWMGGDWMEESPEEFSAFWFVQVGG
jgi:hypothetical protein